MYKFSLGISFAKMFKILDVNSNCSKNRRIVNLFIQTFLHIKVNNAVLLFKVVAFEITGFQQNMVRFVLLFFW